MKRKVEIIQSQSLEVVKKMMFFILILYCYLLYIKDIYGFRQIWKVLEFFVF